MFVRAKPIGPYRYLYLVESVREGGRTRQRIIKNLGRQELVEARGDLDRLARLAARLARRSLILSLLEDGRLPELACTRIGPPLLFERLWQDTGCQAVLEALLAERAFEFAVERAVFTTVLHRLCAPGSDRVCDKWRGAAGERADRAHPVRAALPQGPGRGAPVRAPARSVQRAVGGVHGHHLARVHWPGRRAPGPAWSFQGPPGRSPPDDPRRRDRRHRAADLLRDVAGHVADVTVLGPMVERLRSRFGVGRICVVADRGMISAATIAALEDRGLEYVLRVRERTDTQVRWALADARPMVPIAVPRAKGETLLEAKEVVVEGRRYIVCCNKAEAERDAANRAAILDGLRRQLKKGDKALVGNSVVLPEPDGPGARRTRLRGRRGSPRRARYRS